MTTRSRTSTESECHPAQPGPMHAPPTRRPALNLLDARPWSRRYYFALVVKNQIVYLAMADNSGN